MPRPRTRGVAIRVFLADGTPQGLRIVERLGWTGLCLAFARADYQVVRLRAEMMRTGVYVLIGPDEDGHRSVRAYIGEGETVRSRLDQHFRERDFWTDAYVLTTTDNSLNKAQIRYLESRLLEVAREVDSAALDNGTAPSPTWLSEPDEAVMDSYLDYGLALLPLLGVAMFELVDQTLEPRTPALAGEMGQSLEVRTLPTSADGARPILHLNTVQTVAVGREDARGFLVFEGALARQQENVMTNGYRRLRAKLIEDGLLVPNGDGQFRLVKNYVFDSPSAAASVLSGGSKNGRTEWKNASGQTLKELEEKAVEEVPDLEGDYFGPPNWLQAQGIDPVAGEDGASAPPAVPPQRDEVAP